MFGFEIVGLVRYPETYVIEFAYSRGLEWIEVDDNDASTMRFYS